MEHWESEVERELGGELPPEGEGPAGEGPGPAPEGQADPGSENLTDPGPEGLADPGPEERAGSTPADGEEGRQTRKDSSPGRELYLNVRVLVTMMTAFVMMFTFVARIIVVSGPSMENTLWGGDLILVWALGYTPRQGDVVVLTQESYQEDSIVKRVIATGGQRVDIDYNTGTVKVDGVALEERYIKEQMLVPGYGEGINHVEVPEGCIFVMGDNRNHSADSRFPAIGIVDVRCIIGHGILVIFPFHHWKGLT